jgi:hypothetical protein
MTDDEYLTVQRFCDEHKMPYPPELARWLLTRWGMENQPDD